MLEFLVHKCIKDADEIERPGSAETVWLFSPPSSESSAM